MALRLPKQDYRDIERIIEFDFVRATEAAALNALRWLGRGDKEAADAAACDAMRGMFDLMNICGEVVIGEGIKDEAPGIFKGEQLGTWIPGSPQFDIAIDPIDGTTNISKGAPNSISCIAAASPEEGVKVALRDIPSFYMSKLAYGARVIDYMKKRGDSLHIDMPIAEMLAIVARAVDKRVQDVAVMMLDRPRHKEIVEQIRAAGASLFPPSPATAGPRAGSARPAGAAAGAGAWPRTRAGPTREPPAGAPRRHAGSGAG